jgi:homoserine kinase
MPERVRVGVPATSANMGPGFDSIGVALGLRGEVELAIAPSPGALPANRGEELAIQAAKQVYRQLGRGVPPLRARLSGNVPIGRGLGSSAIVRVGAVVAAAELAGATLDSEQLLALAAELEGHADNAAPALLGGLQVVVWDEGVVQHLRLPLPEGVQAVLYVPEMEMPTHESRRLLPESLSRREVVHNTSRVALLVAGFATGRLEVLRTATDDVLHQPARAKLFPAMYDIFAAAEQAGALCAYLSGGGSTVLALTRGNEAAVAAAMTAAAEAGGAPGRVLVTTLSDTGVEIIQRG